MLGMLALLRNRMFLVSRSEVAREALRRYLMVMQFDELRRRMMPFAQARGYRTDEDVFADVS